MRSLLLATLAAGAIAAPFASAPAHAECMVKPLVEIEADAIYVNIHRGYCQTTTIVIPLTAPIPPVPDPDCPSHVLISHENGVTYVNVPTGRCTYTAIPLPAPL